MIEAAEQRFKSRPSIRSLSQLIFNAWPGMILFNMSMYAMLEVSFFNLCYCISAVLLIASENATSLPPSRCFVRKYIYDHGPGSNQTFFPLFCFVLSFSRETKNIFGNSHQKGLLHRASSLVITPCSYQSYLSLSCW